MAAKHVERRDPVAGESLGAYEDPVWCEERKVVEEFVMEQPVPPGFPCLHCIAQSRDCKFLFSLLVVREKYGRFRARRIWKIPTGIVDQGEDISVGAKREVQEETGIDTEFTEVLAFRQMHKSFYDKSDLFFLCMLRPLTFDIKNQDSEIDGAQWMPIEEYALQPLAEEQWMFKDVSDLCLAKLDKNYNGFSPLPIRSFFNDLVRYFYVNKHDLKL
ncbi:nudix hydrolase 10-like [Forsythia ovata]|uniref:Nudix hydrolase 10-like n=1 Tax=Forsythia ovata TaxID=205694 RepID=A0ABD1S5D8_9LAMI